MKYVVTSPVVVDDDSSGRGRGPGAPGVSSCPPNVQTASTRLRAVAALIRRRVFTFRWPPKEIKKFFINLDEREFSCKSARDLVRFAGGSFFLAFKVKAAIS